MRSQIPVSFLQTVGYEYTKWHLNGGLRLAAGNGVAQWDNKEKSVEMSEGQTSRHRYNVCLHSDMLAVYLMGLSRKCI
ncbi:unnamed protein product [Onchocerca ochengi]|uniref:N-acetylmuramoyl-L-alanine amidase n=1 Tax=Onchocerca ochengi TaxID=42157 RepID=A0A182EFP7_ONCOC|nr:unnamed protein product [Onchocerca ochengi]